MHKKEKCVLCGKELNVPVEEHVEFRDDYVIGAGQLCPECYARIYNRQTKGEIYAKKQTLPKGD